MTLTDIQISEIKNLDLIYVFSIDSIFNANNKYVGAKIVYDHNRVLSLDYRDSNFQDFIKRILQRYQLEKDKRKIILLGELTKKLVNDSSFAVLDKKILTGVQSLGIPSFNTNDRDLRWNENYLKEMMKLLLSVLKKYECLKIDDIKGFNHKYMVEYSIGSVKQKMPIIISTDGENINFKVNMGNKNPYPITGMICQDNGLINIECNDNREDLKCSIVFDAKNNTNEKKVTSNGLVVFYDENKEILLENDASIIKFYFDLCDFEIPKNILKIADNSFLFSDEETHSEEEGLLYSSTGSTLNIFADEVRLQHCTKNGFTKYDNKIGVTLDTEKEEIIIRKLNIDSKKYLLMERKKQDEHNSTYTYHVYEVAKDIDFSKPFSISNDYSIENKIDTLEKMKKYIKENKGGSKQ